MPPEELRLSLEEAYQQAINEASLEVEAGQYKAKELEQLVNREQILDLALNLILR
ncbi:conserved hypothetical protein [Kamptonema sp. PCC 6506]|nr:conserved hypothetical protein [Kamptonema sp. PCC 6506]